MHTPVTERVGNVKRCIVVRSRFRILWYILVYEYRNFAREERTCFRFAHVALLPVFTLCNRIFTRAKGAGRGNNWFEKPAIRNYKEYRILFRSGLLGFVARVNGMTSLA